MTVKLVKLEYIKEKCPICHESTIEIPKNDSNSYALCSIDDKDKVDTKSFIKLKISKCSHCGAIFTFEN